MTTTSPDISSSRYLPDGATRSRLGVCPPKSARRGGRGRARAVHALPSARRRRSPFATERCRQVGLSARTPVGHRRSRDVRRRGPRGVRGIRAGSPVPRALGARASPHPHPRSDTRSSTRGTRCVPSLTSSSSLLLSRSRAPSRRREGACSRLTVADRSSVQSGGEATPSRDRVVYPKGYRARRNIWELWHIKVCLS